MRIKEGVIIQKLGQSFVAYDNNTSTLHEFNEVGFLIISAIEEKKTKAKIIEKIVKEFKVGRDKAGRDFDEFIQGLRKKDLIVG